MRTNRTQIDKETYKKLKKMKYTDLYEAIQRDELLPVQYFCGYGVYNVQLRRDGDECYIVCDIGDSCD